MIRLVVRQDDAAMAANVGGPVQTTYRIFDLDLPELEAFIRETGGISYVERTIIGGDVFPPAAPSTGSAER